MVRESGRRVTNPRERGIRLYPTEEEEQIAVMSWAAMSEGRFPELRLLLFHVPNGGKRGKREAAVFRAMGVKPGVSDLMLAVPSGGYHGLFIEMKAVDGRASPDQKAFLEAADRAGYCCRICYGSEAAVRVIEDYLEGKERA